MAGPFFAPCCLPLAYHKMVWMAVMSVSLTWGCSSTQHRKDKEKNNGELRSSSIAFIGNSLHVNPPNLPKPNFRDYKYIYKKGSVKDFCSSSKNKESIYSQVSF